MTDDYMPPQSVMNSWREACSCCPECSQNPCDGVMAGGFCDNMPCECDDEYIESDFDLSADTTGEQQ